MGLKERMAAALSGSSWAGAPTPQPQAPQLAHESPPSPEAPQPAAPAPAARAQPSGSQQRPEASSRPSGNSSLLAKIAFAKEVNERYRVPAVSQADLLQPSQRHQRQPINGRLVAFGTAPPAANTSATSYHADTSQQHQQQQLQPQHPAPAGQPTTQAAASRHDGIDRAAARATVVLSASQDDFEFDASEALRKAGAGAGGGGAAGARRAPAEARPATQLQQQQQQQLANELDDLLPSGSQRAAAKPRGKRGGTATTPGAPRRKAAAGGLGGGRANGKSGGGGKGSGKGQARRKAAAPKRNREEPSQDDGEEGSGMEDGGLADLLLLPPEEPAAGRAAAAPAAAAEAQQERRAPGNAPLDGPNEELRLAVGEDGEPWPEDAQEEAYLNFAVPASINRFLRSYQRDGIRFLMRQYARGTGGILGDDMGLGKTVQAIGFIAAVLGKTGDLDDAHLPELQPLRKIEPLPDSEGETQWGLVNDDAYAPDYSTCYPVLVVAPTSVLENWEREFDMWGKFRVAVCKSKQRDASIAAIRAGQKEIMIVSYNMLLGDPGEELLTIPWHMALFDEAHFLKNSLTKRYMLGSRLPTRLRYGLTGTPFQNDYAEIWAVMNFMAPGCLGERKEYMDGTARPIMRGQQASSSDNAKAVGAEAQHELRAVLARYMLRRTKKLIADQMPKKMDYAVFCELSPLQLAAYKRLLESPDVELLLNHREPCLECGSGEPYYKCCGWKVEEERGGVLWPMYHCCECDDAYDKDYNPKGCRNHKPDGCWQYTPFGYRRMCPFCLILPCCSILRKISNHLELVKAQHEDEIKDPRKFKKALQIAELVIGEDSAALGGYVTSEEFIRLSDTSTCGKMEALDALLKTWRDAGSNKVLLFSNSVQTLNILKAMVTASGYDYIMLDGSVPQAERQTLCDKFNTQPSTFIFLISTLAGGVGLNLTAANKVVIFDPSWNPAMDLQAQDRAFRIGQKRDVSVYRLIAAGTMEEIIYDRQLYKQMHSEIVLEGNTAMPRTFEGAKTGNREDHGELFGMLNLLKHNKEKILTLEYIENERRRRARGDRDRDGYRIEAYDPDAEAREAAAAAALPRARRGGAEVADGEDAGLQALVAAELGILPEEAEAQPRGGSPSQDGAGGGERQAAASGGLLAAEQEGEERWEEHRAETELLAKAGVTGMLQHNLVFKPSAAEAAATRAAEDAVEAEAQRKQGGLAEEAVRMAGKRQRTQRAQRTRPEQVACGGGGRVQARVLPLLESVAEALGQPAEVAARRLLDLQPEARRELRRALARGDDPPLALPTDGARQAGDCSGRAAHAGQDEPQNP